MKKVILILMIALIALVSCVNAETLSGTLGEIGINSTYYTTPTGSGGYVAFNTLEITDIQYSSGTTAIILFNGVKNVYAAGAAIGKSVPMILTGAGNVTIGTGYIGYQRAYDSGGTEQPGYTYLQFTTYDPGALTGSLTAKIWCNETELGLTGYGGAINGYAPPSGLFGFGQQPTTVSPGQYLVNKDISTLNEYSASNAGGWITGYINKVSGETTYPSQAFLFNENGTILSSQSTSTPIQFNFTLVQQPIKLGILTPNFVWYNTSILFSSLIPTPTVTPTATPTTAPTIAPGYVRTYVETIDGTSGYTIHGSNIFLYDVEGSVWSNSSSDSNGEHYIDTLPYHTVNAYATYTVFADHYSNAESLGLPTGYYGDFHYKLSMFPPAFDPGEGNVNLYVSTFDADTYDIVREASVQIRLPTGAVQGGNTGQSGTEIFVVPNNTVINIAASKAGYVGSNTVVSSGTGTTASAAVYLRRMTVTTVPTNTIPPGGVTTAVTVNPHDPSITGNTNASAQDMMNWLAANGMQLVQLCFLITILGLLGIKLGK